MSAREHGFLTEGVLLQCSVGSLRKPRRSCLTETCRRGSPANINNPPQVRISVHSTPCHADSLKLEVISNKPHGGAEAQQPRSQGRSQLVQEVVRLAEEAYQQAQEKAARRPKFSREEREFRQSKTPNLYSLLEEVRELALMDLEVAAQVGQQ